VVERDLGDVLGSVDIMNTGRDTVQLEYAGQCGLGILLYGEGEASPRWDSSAWWATLGDCPAPATALDLPPRTLARIIAPLLETVRILGDSLPGAGYRAALRIHLLQPRDTTLVLPAGEIQLGGGTGTSLAAGRGHAYE
jgi:hypothetical protein